MDRNSFWWGKKYGFVKRIHLKYYKPVARKKYGVLISPKLDGAYMDALYIDPWNDVYDLVIKLSEN